MATSQKQFKFLQAPWEKLFQNELTFGKKKSVVRKKNSILFNYPILLYCVTLPLTDCVIRPCEITAALWVITMTEPSCLAKCI